MVPASGPRGPSGSGDALGPAKATSGGILSAIVRTYVRVTSDGSPYARFRRALDTGNELLVLNAARELPQIALEDALRICLVLRDGDPARYDRAAVRWLGRFALEARAATIADLRTAAAALAVLPTATTDAMEQLQRLCMACGVS